MQHNAATQERNNKGFWPRGLDGAAIGATTYSLFMLFVSLVVAKDPHQPKHNLLIVGALVGFLTHVVASSILITRETRRT